ncbi:MULTISPECIES: acyl carrier protein [Streptomyces]|uniref:acyl carrier protein n=1 Tax=Streptomyces TaxID=1883 RepID=UPI00234AFDA2|nr:acyl carrier protein [Streptomyces sp. M92]WCN02366.1 acyl carrier protein [Streptomyces sp. M92]
MSTDQATTTTTTTVRTPEEVREWLTERVAYFLDVTPQDIASDALLVEIGLDSVYALTLCGDVEEQFGIVVEATLAWDHPTVDALTTHIHAQIADPR